MIEKYLTASCLSIIDDFNEKHSNLISQPQLRDIANQYMETDLVFRIGYFFGNRATFERKFPKTENRGITHCDIVVESKDFKIEVKFLKGQKNETKKGEKDKNKVTWKAIKKDFDWLQKEVIDGYGGKRAFVIGWFNSAKFNELMQLGTGDGRSPTLDPDKEFYFPFLDFDHNNRKTDTVKYIYKQDVKPLPVKIPEGSGKINCLFLGSKDDVFHMAIYY